jgi:hypothetical protein
VDLPCHARKTRGHHCEVCRFVIGKLKLTGGWRKMADRRDRHFLAELSIYIQYISPISHENYRIISDEPLVDHALALSMVFLFPRADGSLFPEYPL